MDPRSFAIFRQTSPGSSPGSLRDALGGTLSKRSKRLASNGADGDGKMRRLTNEIKKKRRLISTLEVTLDTQQEQLRAVTMSEAATAKGNRNDDDDDDYDDDSSGDDADDGTAE